MLETDPDKHAKHAVVAPFDPYPSLQAVPNPVAAEHAFVPDVHGVQTVDKSTEKSPGMQAPHTVLNPDCVRRPKANPAGLKKKIRIRSENFLRRPKN